MEKDIGKIKKNEITDIVVRVDDFGGRAGVTIREFMKGDRYTGFTKSGTKIPIDSFEEFKELINSITNEDLEAAKEEAETVEAGKEQAEEGKEETAEEEQETLAQTTEETTEEGEAEKEKETEEVKGKGKRKNKK